MRGRKEARTNEEITGEVIRLQVNSVRARARNRSALTGKEAAAAGHDGECHGALRRVAIRQRSAARWHPLSAPSRKQRDISRTPSLTSRGLIGPRSTRGEPECLSISTSARFRLGIRVRRYPRRPADPSTPRQKVRLDSHQLPGPSALKFATESSLGIICGTKALAPIG